MHATLISAKSKATKKITLIAFVALTLVTSILRADEVILDTITTTTEAVRDTQPDTQKLLKIPGAGNDPLKAIEALPGVVIGKSGDSRPAIRGSSPEDNAYYLDFLPIGYLFHNDGSSIINDELVKSFKLYPAAFGGEYNHAIGGVINTESRSPKFDESQVVTDLSLLRAGVLVDAPISDNQAFFLSGRMSLFQYYLENFIDEDEFEFTVVPEFYDYQGSWEYRPDALSSLRFQVVGARDKAGINFSDDSDTVKQDPALSGGINAEQYFNSQGIVWDSIASSGLTSRVGFSHLEQSVQFSVGRGNFIKAKNNRLGIRSQFSLPLGFSHELQWGLEYAEEHIEYRGEFTAPPCDEFKSDCRLSDATETVSGSGTLVIPETYLNLSDQWDITTDWQLTPGVLFSHNSYTNNTYSEPKLNQRIILTPTLTWTAGYGHYHALTENPGRYTEDFGNPDLNESASRHYVTGLEYELKPGLMLTTEVYYKSIDDIIVARPEQSFFPTLSEAEYNDLPRYTNDAEGSAWGVETLINANFSERWYGWVSVALSRTERRNNLTGEEFRYSYDQPLVINAVGNYKLNKDWSLGAKWRYESGQLITPLEGSIPDSENPELYNPIYGDPFSERLPAYHRLDIRADRSYQYATWRMDLYIELLNLYARKNIIDYSYENADYSKREDVTDLPPIPSIGVKLIF